jgi:hypothetical protein
MRDLAAVVLRGCDSLVVVATCDDEDRKPGRVTIAPLLGVVMTDDRTDATTDPVVLAELATVGGRQAGSSPVTHE